MFILNLTYLIVVFSLVNDILSFDVCFEDNLTEISSYNSRNVTKTCGCERTTCIRKCCKPGFFLRKKFCNKHSSRDTFKLPVYTNKTVLVRELKKNDSFLVGVMDCMYFRMNVSNPKDVFYAQENGKVWVPRYKQFFENDEYCVDELYGTTIFLCFPKQNFDVLVGRQVNVIGMIISMPFLLVTFLVYAILPDPNLHRKALMFYVLTLLLSYICLVTVQLYDGKFQDFMCQSLGYSVVFFFIGSFFWMNVMCIDMWLAFSGLRGFNGQRHAERKRFIIYCIYAWGMPVLHILIILLINTYGDPETSAYPAVGRTKCFLDDGLPNLLYFYGPMAIITGVNIVLFILTAIKIRKVKRETSVLKHTDSKRHSYEDDKQKFNLYLKLLFAMGINWSMEIISWAIGWKMGNQIPSYVWYLTDFCNAMYGVFIFFIFVFKKKIWKSLQKRCFWKLSTETITTGLSTPHLSSNMKA